MNEERRATIQRENKVIDEVGKEWGGKPPWSASFIASVIPDPGVPFCPSGKPTFFNVGSWLEMRKFAESLSLQLRPHYLVPRDC